MDKLQSVGESSCCGAEVYAPTSAWTRCLFCKENCEIIGARKCKECGVDLEHEDHDADCYLWVEEQTEKHAEEAYEFSRGN